MTQIKAWLVTEALAAVRRKFLDHARLNFKRRKYNEMQYERQIYDVNDETERALHSYWVEETNLEKGRLHSKQNIWIGCLHLAVGWGKNRKSCSKTPDSSFNKPSPM